MAQLGAALGGTTSASFEVEARVAEVTDAMQPVFFSLPRSPKDYLGASAVRYLLHRYFLDRDGWFVQGWDATGEEADISLPRIVLQDDPLAEVLSERLAAKGLSLREVAVLAIGMETLASEETVQRLDVAYRFAEASDSKSDATEEQLSAIHDIYNCIYVLGKKFRIVTPERISRKLSEMQRVFPRWDEFRMWFSELRDELQVPASFDGQVRLMEEMQHRYGRWADLGCRSVKQVLLQYSTPGTGRVPLGSFYSTDLPGGWEATESAEYLKELGALDDADPSSPSVVVTNYFDTPSNCANTSSYYSVCCIIECEELLGSLERKLQSPSVPPQQIIDLVEIMPSATVQAPRTLSTQLVDRLHSIATAHGGNVPLHSRLFRQWMHHAYPSECVFPALSITQWPRNPAQFERETGHSSRVDDETRMWYVEESRKDTLSAFQPVDGGVGVAPEPEQELPWSDDDELFITCSTDGGDEADEPADPTKPRSASWRPVFLLVCVLGSMVYMLVREATAVKTCMLPTHGKKRDV